MVKVEDIREWRGHDVIDASGSKVGEMEAVYVDTRTDRPTFITVKTGLPTRQRLVFAPLEGAVVGPGHVRIPYAKKQIKNAPSIGMDGELLAKDEQAVFDHYDLPYQAALDERRLARR